MLTSLIFSLATAATNPVELKQDESISTTPTEHVVQLSAQSEFVAPVAIQKFAPQFPRQELREGREGWAVVSYVVDTQGNVVNAVIDDSSGSRYFERAAIAAALKAKYEPATLNGEAIESCNNANMFTFEFQNSDGSPSNDGGSRRYRTANNAAVEAYQQANWTEFSAAVAELAEISRGSFYEEANFQMLNGLDLELRNEPTEALKAYQKAVNWGVERLSMDNAAVVVKQGFALLLDTEDYVGAVDWAAGIPEEWREVPQIMEVIALGDQINAQLEQREYVVVNASLGERGAWSKKLARPVFELAVNEGEVSAFELRCSGKFKRYDYTGQGAFTIPSSWGECSLRLEGSTNANVSVYQFNS